MVEPAVVGYDLASVKNQQLSSYPRCDYSLQVAVRKARLGLGYVRKLQVYVRARQMATLVVVVAATRWRAVWRHLYLIS